MSFLASLRSYLRKEKRLAKVVWLGLDFAGKTTIIRRIVTSEFKTNTTRTLGLNVDEFSLDQSLKMVCWDIGGQQVFRETLWVSYIDEASGIVFVVDSSDENRFAEAKDELWRIVLANPKVKNIPILVLANKQDLPTSVNEGELAKALDLDKVVSSSFAIMACSAATGFNVLEGMTWLSDRITHLKD
jgi:small GTP-binding protein